MLRIFVLLWLAWYIWGPVDPMVDFWDSPRQTMADMERAAGGVVVLIAAGFVMAKLLSRNLRERFRLASHTALGLIVCPAQVATASHFSIPYQLIHSPPVPLRI